MRKKSYTVKLTDEQKEQLNALINKGKHSARVIKRARLLLMAEQDKKDEEISAFDAREALRIHRKLEFHYTPKHASWLNMAEIKMLWVNSV